MSHTKFNLREQLLDHDYRILKMEQELESHVNKPPESRTASRRILAEYAEKEIFFQNEVCTPDNSCVAWHLLTFLFDYS